MFVLSFSPVRDVFSELSSAAKCMAYDEASSIASLVTAVSSYALTKFLEHSIEFGVQKIDDFPMYLCLGGCVLAQLILEEGKESIGEIALNISAVRLSIVSHIKLPNPLLGIDPFIWSKKDLSVGACMGLLTSTIMIFSVSFSIRNLVKARIQEWARPVGQNARLAANRAFILTRAGLAIT